MEEIKGSNRFTMLALLSLTALILPDLVGFKNTIALKLSSKVLLSVYVIISFERVHRPADL